MLRSMVERLGKFDYRRRFFPSERITKREQFDALVNLGILDGFAPSAPFITKASPLVTMGSCFAQNVASNLSAAGYDVFTLPIADRLFTPVALRTFITEALRAARPIEELREHWNLQQDQIDTMRALIIGGAPVIITFGLSTVWVEKATGKPILDRSKKAATGLLVPNPERYEMRQMPVDEITEAMTDIIGALRQMNFSNKIIFTLSPIPLIYSGSDYPVVAADCLSKSALRVAIDEIGRAKFRDIHYFPSFEILRWLAPMAAEIWHDGHTVTHIRSDWITYTVGKFRQIYCADDAAVTLPPFPNPDT